jgi:hypothetical protein
MKQRCRIYYTESQKALMWERWRKGESLQQIAQLFDRNHSSSIQRILAGTATVDRRRGAKRQCKVVQDRARHRNEPIMVKYGKPFNFARRIDEHEPI